MKLYTEEQVKEIIDIAEFGRHRNYDELLREFTPVQLPTEEEIEHVAEEHATFAPSFKYGVKFVFDKILNQQ